MGPLMKTMKRHLIEFHLRNVGANLVGFATVASLNALTPHDVFRAQRHYLLQEGHQVFLLWVTLVVILAAVAVQCRLQYPIHVYLTGKDASSRARLKAARRLVNLPFLVSAGGLFMWFLLPAAVASLLVLFQDVPVKIALFAALRATIVGLVSSTLSFFLLEEHARNRLVPLLYPEGKLTLMPGTVKLPVLGRIRILYVTGTLVPMIILLATYLLVLKGMEGATPEARIFAREMFYFTGFLSLVFLMIAFRLTHLVGRSISDPVKNIMRSVKAARQGRFHLRIQVVSNDEIGALGDAANEMMAGLEEREFIKDLFGKYVAPEVRDEILSGRIPLDGERRRATVLFADLRGFTAYVEAHPPEEVIHGMRSYFSAMDQAVRAHGGLVLQYVGDEVEAVFGVPLPLEDHAQRAVAASLLMRQALKRLNRQRESAGLAPFSHGVGIHTGEVLAGNMGSETRLSYALIGDTVNLASRIQDLTKRFGCDVLASAETVAEVQGRFVTEAKPPVQVKGYSRPIQVYAVRGLAF